jgi:hypothetical protein
VVPLEVMLEQLNAVAIRIDQMPEVADVVKLPGFRHINPTSEVSINRIVASDLIRDNDADIKATKIGTNRRN